MRHWFIVIMIALLPLRGWVGDAMALDMLAPAAHTSMAMDAHGAGQDHCACDEHAAHTDAPADHQHSACDVCNLPALATTALAPQGPAAMHTPFVPPAERFASSEAQRGIKPPIS